MKPYPIKYLAPPVLVACGLLFGAVRAHALVTVEVGSTQQWLGWMNVWQTNGTSLVSGNSWGVADLRATFMPTNSPSGWPLNAQLVLSPNTSTYNPGDAFWDLPDGSPNKVLQAIFYVDVFTGFAGQTVAFKGSVTSNSIPGLTGGPATGWRVVEACTNLPAPDWSPVSTNTLINGWPYFSDPQWANHPNRFYRVRSPWCAA
jgi:hypothetical protein